MNKTARLAAILFTFSMSMSGVSAQPQAAPPGITRQEVTEFNAALKLYNAGSYQEAFDKAAPISKAHPTFLQAHVIYGASLLKLGRIDEALQEFHQAESIDPNDGQTLLNLSTAYMLLGQRDKAFEKLQTYLKKNPNGQFATEAQSRIDMLNTEAVRNKGVTNSAGLDNYLDEAVAVGAMRWKASQMPILVYITPGENTKGFRPEFYQFLKDAFQTWSEASNEKISFKHTNNSEEALITCEFIDNPAKLVNPAEGGESMPMVEVNGTMTKGRMKILTHKPPYTIVPDALIKTICLHEVGHVVGIAGHSSQPGDIMFAVTSDRANSGLSERDKKTVALLYAAPDTIFSEHPVKLANLSFQGNQGSSRNRAIKINGEAVEALAKHDYDKAIPLLNEAIRLAPEAELYYSNLAKAYSELGNEAVLAHNAASAQKNFELAITNLVKAKRKDLATKLCDYLITFAQNRHDQEHLKKYQDLKHQITGSN